MTVAEIGEALGRVGVDVPGRAARRSAMPSCLQCVAVGVRGCRGGPAVVQRREPRCPPDRRCSFGPWAARCRRCLSPTRPGRRSAGGRAPAGVGRHSDLLRLRAQRASASRRPGPAGGAAGDPPASGLGSRGPAARVGPVGGSATPGAAPQTQRHACRSTDLPVRPAGGHATCPGAGDERQLRSGGKPLATVRLRDVHLGAVVVLIAGRDDTRGDIVRNGERDRPADPAGHRREGAPG